MAGLAGLQCVFFFEKFGSFDRKISGYTVGATYAFFDAVAPSVGWN